MSFLKYIMSPFVDFNEQKEQDATSGSAAQIAEPQKVPDDAGPINVSRAQAPVTVWPSPTGLVSGVATTSAEHQKHFEELIEEANAKNPLFQGTDFKEFIDSKVDVESIADEGTRYKTAFNVLKRTGLSKERLISTGQQYINLIAGDIKGFENAYTQQYKKDVEDKERALQMKSAELNSLNEKIAALNQEMKLITEEIAGNRQRLNSNKDSFVSAGENKLKEIEAELQKISQYF